MNVFREDSHGWVGWWTEAGNEEGWKGDVVLRGALDC